MNRGSTLDALMIAIALLVLGAAICFARAVRGTGPSRGLRILLPAIYFVLATVLIFCLPLLLLGQPVVGPAQFAWGLLWLALPALLASVFAEGIVFALNAERTRQWLIAGIVAAIAAVYGLLILWRDGVMLRMEPAAIIPAFVAAATAIVWWPYLPRGEGDDVEDLAAAEPFE